jgi:hypothetical protein
LHGCEQPSKTPQGNQSEFGFAPELARSIRIKTFSRREATNDSREKMLCQRAAFA